MPEPELPELDPMPEPEPPDPVVESVSVVPDRPPVVLLPEGRRVVVPLLPLEPEDPLMPLEPLLPVPDDPLIPLVPLVPLVPLEPAPVVSPEVEPDMPLDELPVDPLPLPVVPDVLCAMAVAHHKPATAAAIK